MARECKIEDAMCVAKDPILCVESPNPPPSPDPPSPPPSCDKVCTSAIILEAEGSNNAESHSTERCCNFALVGGAQYTGYGEATVEGRSGFFSLAPRTSATYAFTISLEIFEYQHDFDEVIVSVVVDKFEDVLTRPDFNLSLDVFTGLRASSEADYAALVADATYSSGSVLWFHTQNVPNPTSTVLIEENAITPYDWDALQQTGGTTFEFNAISAIRSVANSLSLNAGEFIALRLTAYNLPDCSRPESPCIGSKGYAISDFALTYVFEDEGTGLSTGAIVGIVFASIAGLFIISYLGYFMYKQQTMKNMRNMRNIPDNRQATPNSAQNTSERYLPESRAQQESRNGVGGLNTGPSDTFSASLSDF